MSKERRKDNKELRQKKTKLVQGVGINDANYITQLFEIVEGTYTSGKSKQRQTWVCVL